MTRTTVVGRVALTMLEARASRREDVEAELPEATVAGLEDAGRISAIDLIAESSVLADLDIEPTA